MVSPLPTPTISHLEGAVWTLLGIVSLKLLDIILKRFIERRILTEIYKKLTKKAKAFLTRRNKIRSAFEFSIYTKSHIQLSKAQDQLKYTIELLEKKSEEIEKIDAIKWDQSDTEASVKLRFRDKQDPYEIQLRLVEDQDNQRHHSNANSSKRLSSIGITITFSFAFAELRSAIIDLQAFADQLLEALKEVYPVKSVSNGRFVVSPIDGELTMEEWIEQKRFDVSLLLKSENEERAVRFHGDRAEIRSPTRQIDDETVEYVRETLLNYYL